MAASSNLYSLRGRLARRPYWRVVGVIVAIRLAAAVALIYNPDWDFVRHLGFLLFLLAILIGKRMKDFGVAPYWGWGAIAVISFLLPAAIYTIWARYYDIHQPAAFVRTLVEVIPVTAFVILIVAIGCKRGDPAENRYGLPSP